MTTSDLQAGGLILQAIASLLYVPIWRSLVKLRLDLAEKYVTKVDHKEDIKNLETDMDKMEGRIMSNSRIRVVKGGER